MKRLSAEHAGTIVEGTTRVEHLVFKLQAKGYLTPKLCKEWKKVTSTPVLNPMAVYAVMEAIVEHMDEIAPEGYHFGSHPDDGADWGFWPDEWEG